LKIYTLLTGENRQLTKVVGDGKHLRENKDLYLEMSNYCTFIEAIVKESLFLSKGVQLLGKFLFGFARFSWFTLVSKHCMVQYKQHRPHWNSDRKRQT
jgi:hypothetical protein